jgi:very-short-patch-repair endonuclease
LRYLRTDATDAERILWRRLRNRGFMGLKFRRQHPVAGFILDFYCNEAKLGVEVDGDQHADDEHTRYDEERSRILAGQHGIEVIRFRNDDVINRIEQVLGDLRDALLRRQSLISGKTLQEQDSFLPVGEAPEMRDSRSKEWK